jgi:nitrous oxide reductase accessory protein NosL
MKKLPAIWLGISLLVGLAAFPYISGMGVALAQEDIAKQAACPYCGMDRQKFAHSRIFVTYDDGSTLGTCSIHCAAVDLAINIDKTPKAIMVGDFNTKDLIDAEKAVWVMGGSKMGVMTRRAKWAFGSQNTAEDFIKQNGGEVVAFEQVIKAAYEDMYQDTRMIREKRKMKRMHKQ